MIVSTYEALLRLRNGEVIGMPTETVYGLAGRIDNEVSLRSIFSLKERPFFDPLIVHVHGIDSAKSLVSQWPLLAHGLAESFWPGPLTLVLPKHHSVHPVITSGLETVAVRWPAHPIAQELIAKLGVPLAAPSANRFGRTSPTQAWHVEQEFKAQDIAIVDGGPCTVGVESTVLLIEGENQIAVLREGMITKAMIEMSLQKQGIKFDFLNNVDATKSPGHLKHHYMPPIPLIYLRGEQSLSPEVMGRWFEDLQKLPSISSEGIRMPKPKKISSWVELRLPENPVMAARELYSSMRVCSASQKDVIVFFERSEMQSQEWSAILDRLQKAATLK